MAGDYSPATALWACDAPSSASVCSCGSGDDSMCELSDVCSEFARLADGTAMYGTFSESKADATVASPS